MNAIVSAWQRHESRKRIPFDTPDTLVLDGQAVILIDPHQQVSEFDMAQRKAPQTEPVLDSAGRQQQAATNIIAELPKADFHKVLHYVQNSSQEQARQLRTATFNTLKRLGVKRDTSRAIDRAVRSDGRLGDTRSIVVWMNRIAPGDKKAVDQLLVIDACCVKRG
jgi:hypothetical protein